MDLAAPQRALVDEEAEAQVMQRERRDVRAQALAGAQAAEDRPGHRGALAVVAREADPALPHVGPRDGLGDVVQQRAPAQRAAARQPVRERLAEQLADAGGALGAEHRRRVALRARSSRSSTASVCPWTSRWW